MKQPGVIWLAGGVTATVVAGCWSLPVAGFFTVVAMATALRRRTSWWLLAGCLLGVGRITTSSLLPGDHDIGRLAGREVTGPAVVKSNPELKHGRLKTVVSLREGRYRGNVLASFPAGSEVAPGDHLVLQGRLMRPRNFSGFAYADYLANDRIFATMEVAAVASRHRPRSLPGTLYRFRQALSRELSRLFPADRGGLLRGILIGDRSGLSEGTEDDFRRSGLSHVLALSGYNISLLLIVVIGLCGRRPWGIALALFTVGLFVVMVGASASVVRAALMGGLIVLAQAAGRPQTALRALLITGAGLLLWHPHDPRYDISLDLSWLATAGILLLEPPLRRCLQRWPDLVAVPLAATGAATLFTLPLIVATFGQASLVSPLANVLFVPFVPWLMLGGFAAALAGLAYPPAGTFLAGSTDLVARHLLTGIHRLAHLPAASLDLSAWRGPAAISALGVSALVVGRLWLAQRSYSRGKSPEEESSAGGLVSVAGGGDG